MRVHVGIPWRAGDPWREQAFAYVQIHLRGAGLDPVPYDNGADIATLELEVPNDGDGQPNWRLYRVNDPVWRPQ